MAVLDHLHARLRRAGSRSACTRAWRRTCPSSRRLHRCAELVLVERRDVERTVRRRDAAAGGELDLRRAEQQLLARAYATSSGESATMLPPRFSMRLNRPPIAAADHRGCESRRGRR